jgi:predicted DNA-binding WGR domain protein
MWCLIREWGRIGRAGQERMASYATAAEAHEALARQQKAKERRGYRSPGGIVREL